MRHAGLLALPLALLACASDPATTDDFGALEGSDARIALVSDDTALVAYVCGGPTTLASLTGWFVGAAGATHLESGGAVLELSRTSTGASGVLTARDGARLRFEAQRAPADAEGGLFEVVDQGCRAGVVFDPARGAQGAWCDGEGRFAQVDPGAPFDPAAIEAGVMRPDGATSLRFTRVVPADRFVR